MNPIRVSKGRIVSPLFSFVGSVLLFVVYMVLFDNLSENMFILTAIIISPILPILWTSRYILEVNPSKKIIHEYAWILGKKIGKPENYNAIENIFLKEISSSQRMTSHGGHVHTAYYHDFAGFIKFDSGNKIEFLRVKDKQYALDKLNIFAKKLGTKLIDLTL